MIVAATMQSSRLNVQLLSAFGLLAVVIAAIGVYAVTAYSVAQRTREIAIRQAFGARRRDIRTMVLRRTGTLALAGIALGALGFWLLRGVVSGFLFEVDPFDPPSLATVAMGLAIIAMLASYLPARRATSVEAAETLKAD